MQRSSTPPRRRLRVLLAAILLFAAVFTARAVDGSTASGVTILYILPIVLVAVEFGRRPGVVAGLVGLALFALWAGFASMPVGVVAYLARATVFVLVGAVAGHMADRLRSVADSVYASARHFELARDMLCTASFDGYFTHLNGAWEACLGWSREELMARPFAEFVHPEDRARTEQEAASLLTGDFTANFTNRYRTKDGDWRWIEWSSKAEPTQGTVYAAARDVTERHRVEQELERERERLRFLAEHDPLSGVYNRRRFEQELGRELGHRARRDRRSVVALLDVDKFKAINDTFGHATGDAVIAAVGETLRNRLRTSDVVARLGGDEFAILLRRVDLAEAHAIASGAQELVTERLAGIVGDALGPVTLSIGLAPLGEQAGSADEVLSAADRAMYEAKRQGGDRVVIASGALASGALASGAGSAPRS